MSPLCHHLDTIYGDNWRVFGDNLSPPWRQLVTTCHHLSPPKSNYFFQLSPIIFFQLFLGSLINQILAPTLANFSRYFTFPTFIWYFFVIHLVHTRHIGQFLLVLFGKLRVQKMRTNSLPSSNYCPVDHRVHSASIVTTYVV